MPDFVVSTAFKVSGDEITPAYLKMGRAAEGFSKKARTAFSRSAASADDFGNEAKDLRKDLAALPRQTRKLLRETEREAAELRRVAKGLERAAKKTRDFDGRTAAAARQARKFAKDAGKEVIELRRLEKQFGRTSRAAKGASRARGGGPGFGKLLGADIAARGLTRGLSLAERGIETVATEFIAFDSSIGRAAAKFPIRIKRGTDEFAALEAAAREVGATTEFTAAQAAEGLEEYAKAGIDSATAMGLLAGTAELATNANVEFAQAADFSLTALDAFNLRSKDAAVTAKNLARVNDTLTAVVNSAKLDVEDFNETLKFTGPVASAVGASLEDMAAMTGLVAKAGIRGSLAGTALKNIYLGLAAQTPKATKVLKKLKIDAVDPLTGDVRDAFDVLNDFNTATKDLGNAQRLAYAETIFGRRSISAVSKVLGLGADEIENYRQSLDDAKGASSAMATEIRKSLENKLKTLQSAAIEVGFKFLDAFKEDGVDGVEALTKAVREFDIKPVIADAKEILEAFKWLFRTVRDNMDLIKTMVKLFVALKVALAAISFVQAIQGAVAFTKAAIAAATASSALQAPVGAGSKAAGGLGKVGQAGAVLGAGVAGYGLGTVVEEFWLSPMREEGLKLRTGFENLNQKLSLEELKTGGFEGLTEKEIQLRMAQIKASLGDLPPAVSSMDEAIGSFFSAITGGETAFDRQSEQIRESARLHRELADALIRSRQNAIAANERALEREGLIDINVSTPAGSKVTSESKGNAPPVNQKQAGAI